MKPQMIKVFETFAVVEGSGEFPIDMLRYDSAIPAREIDSNRIASHSGRRRVVLQIRSKTAASPTPRRWASFGWSVIGAFSDRADAEELRDAPCETVDEGR